MRRFAVVILILVALLVAACEGFSQTGVSTKTRSNLSGGEHSVRIRKANGTAEQDIELEASTYSGEVLETDVTLSVEKGMFRIALLGKDSAVTLELEARDGQTASGHGQMVVDSFGDASYRVTAEEAENVEYTIQWSFQ